MTDVLSQLTAALADRYTVERELGAGGMATVYLAEDLKHHRKVAVKVLRPELAAILGPERFLKEIEVTANLQHPHILPLYDSGKAVGRYGGTAVEESREFLYYVMPYVEGESLRERLNREKQLSVEHAVETAKAVASALDYAHRHEVVHRDIKPENILIHDGQPVVADFGIALAISAAGGTRLTETGLSLGTPHYMSPEQATADRELDARSDVYSLGAVVYEMLVGEPPHVGNSAQAIVAKILSDTPAPVSRTRELVPTNVEAAVTCALAKSPADRFSSAAEFSAALSNPAFTLPSASGPVATSPSREGVWKRVALGLAAVAVVIAVIAAWGWMRPEPQPPVSRYMLGFLPGQEPNFDPFGAFAGIAPDGSWIIYSGPGESGGQLWMKPRDQVEARPIVGTEGFSDAWISPDGERIAYVVGSELRVIRLVGGGSVGVADSVARAGSWLDAASYMYVDLVNRIRLASVFGGVPEILFDPEPGSGVFMGPSPLPGGKKLMFLACPASCDLKVLDLESGGVHSLPIGGVLAFRFVPTGHLLIARIDGTAVHWSAVAFDPESLQMSGTEVPLDEGMLWVDFALDGTAVVLEASFEFGTGPLEAVWVNRSGVVTPVDADWSFRLNTSLNYGWALSPDGTHLAIGLNTDYGNDIWIKELDGGAPSRFTFDETDESRPRWNDDGSSLSFVSNRAQTLVSVPYTGPHPDYYDLYEKRTDGTGQAVLLYSLESRGVVEAMVDEESGWVVMRAGGAGFFVGGRNIYAARLGIDSIPRPLLAHDYDEASVALSPDARWLAYTSRESGRMEVIVRPFPNVEDGQWQISTGGGTSPIWAHSGQELFYVSSTGEMMAVSVQTDPVFAVRQQETLFSLGPEYVLEENYTVFDISPDDERFIMARRVETQGESTARLVLVENWFEELRQIMGGNQ